MNHNLKYRIDLNDGSFGPTLKQAISQTQQLDGVVNKLGATMAAAFTISKAREVIDNTTQVALKMQGLDNVVKFASQNTSDYAANQKFLNELVRDMKLPLVETTEGFSSLMGAMKGSQLQGQATRDIFRGVATASTVLHLSNQQQSSAFLALQQIMSKGKLSAQELTLQLGNAIPGANRLAADSMGMTSAAFAKAMENGEILATDFLPKFAAHLEKVFGPGLNNALDSYQSKMNEVNNSIIKQESLIGEKLMPVKLKMLEVEGMALSVLGKTIEFYDEHSNAINYAVGAYAAYKGVTMGVIAAKQLQNYWTNLGTAAVVQETTAETGLSASVAANTAALISNTAALTASSRTVYTYTVSLQGASAAATAYTTSQTGVAVAQTTVATTATAATGATRALGTAMAATPWGLIALAIGTIAFAFGEAADQAERLNRIKDDVQRKFVENEGDKERQSIQSLAESLEKKKLAKKGEGLKMAVSLEKNNTIAEISEKERLASTATGDTRKKLLNEIEILKARQEAITEVEQNKLGKKSQTLPGAAPSQTINTGGQSSTSGGTGGGGSGKAGVIIQSVTLAKELHIHSIDGNIPEAEIERQVNNLFIRMLRDAETIQ